MGGGAWRNSRLPAAWPSLLRAAAPWKRPAGPTTRLPVLTTRVQRWYPDVAAVRAHAGVVGSTAAMSVAYPQIPLTALQRDLVSRWSFPVRAMGLVHPGVVIEVDDDLPVDAPWDLVAGVEGARRVRSGLEFDLVGEVSVAGRVRWRSRAITLSRNASAGGGEDSACPEFEDRGDSTHRAAMDVPGGTGRAFARVSGDINPIHLHRITARPFGYREPIAHGWWILGRIAALLGCDEVVPGRQVRVAFRRPVPIPSTPTLCSVGATDGSQFALVRAHDERELVRGSITGA